MMAQRRRQRTRLGIAELAVDPADVDSERYPVRIRLTRTLTRAEAESLAVAEPDLRAEGDAIVVPRARLDDVAHDHDVWAGRLERLEALAREREGEGWIADDVRVTEQERHGSHLQSQHVDDRGFH
jgi:hypothetical protein